MTVSTSPPQVSTGDVDIPRRPSWRAKRRLSRQLRLRDETSARLAELHRLAEILNQGADLIGRGWLQHSWFAYLDDNGRMRTVTAHNVNRMAGRPVVGACLVGAIVQAGGGLSNLRSQAVQRAVDLTWHTLQEIPVQANHWTSAPEVRMNRVRDLTRWNDHPNRTAPQAEALLRRSAAAASSEAADVSRRSDLDA
jgi:hypothetical protein